MLKINTLNASKFVPGNILKLILLFFKENYLTLHMNNLLGRQFTQNVIFIFFENFKKYFKLVSAVVVISSLGVNPVFTLSIGTPYLLTILLLKFGVVPFTTS